MNRFIFRQGRPGLTAVLLGLMLFSSSAQAHLLKVFAYAEGDQLQGNAYFAGGDPAVEAAIDIRAGEESLGSLRTDAQGEFRFTLGSRESAGAITVIADSGDGHRAEWQIGADELGGALDRERPDRTALSDGDAELLALVERAVARQVGPLRRELQASQQRARLGDILGGIGLIFGFAGTLLWWRSRRPPRP